MVLLKISFLLLSCIAEYVFSAKILVLLPMPGYSHTMPFMPIFKELGKRGHELTMVTPFPQDPLPKGFKEIHVDLNITTFQKMIEDELNFKPSIRNSRGRLFELIGLVPICTMMAPALLKKTKQYMPPAGTKFDLVIMEPFFCMEPLLIASHLYNAPVVATMPSPLMPNSAAPMGTPQAFAYIPNSRLPSSDKMTFFERAWNTLVNVVELVVSYGYYIPKMDKLLREEFKVNDMPYLGDLLKNISLLLSESHFSVHYPRAYHRNVLEVGGIALKAHKPLTKDLEKFMSEAKDGVILFSWGSHFKAEGEDAFVQILMKAFGRLKQKVLFKWFTTDIPNKPDNVLIQTWLPQPAVLAHNKTVLFISHCGLNSMYEAAYFGVPVLGTPLFGDQPHNAKLMEDVGTAISLSVEEIESGEDVLYNTITKIISDQSFRDNAEKRKAMVRDRPMPLIDEAVYWIEYVLKHDGGKHMKPASMFLSWYSLALLDVFLFFAAVLAVPFLLLGLCLKKCFGKKQTPPKPVSKSKKKN